MNQIWNIFRKDARHHWPEITASLALLVAFAWHDIRSWNQLYGGAVAAEISFFLSEQMLGLVNLLLPVSWILLIVRVVQGESLVGDRQFWVTRPYDWKQLLAAKVLFVLAFINFPLLCMDTFLLARAGFHPTHYVAGLLWMQLLWILCLFLWMAGLASVTRNVPQMLLAILFVVLYIIGTSAFLSAIRKSNFSADFDLRWGFLVIGTAVAIILIQYSRRKTDLSRWLIVGVCALLTLISVATSLATPDRSLIARQYPLAGGNLPVQLGLMGPDNQGGKFAPSYNAEVSIMLPLSVAGIPENSFLKLDGMIVTLTSANGFRWDSDWQRDTLLLFPDQKTAHIVFQIKQDILDQLASGPVSARFLLAFTLYRDENRRQFVVPSGKFSLPDLGWCTSEMLFSGGMLNCLAPLRRPAFLLVTSETAASTCPLGSEEPPPPHGIFARESMQGAPGPAEIGISPVVKVEVQLSNLDWFARRVLNPGICPGTPLTLSNPEEAGHRGLEVQFDNLTLDDFRERLPASR